LGPNVNALRITDTGEEDFAALTMPRIIDL